MSRTQNTENEYNERGFQLLQKAYKEAFEEKNKIIEKSLNIKYKGKNVIILDPLYTAVWASQKWDKKYRPNTWSKYRCSIKYIADVFFEKNKLTQEQKEMTYRLLDKIEGGDRKKLEPRTSSHKKKSFSIKEIKQLEEHLENNKYKWGKPTLYWVKASILIGLRPVEWKSVELDLNNKVIIVRNAKNTNGRTFGDFRHLNISHLNNEELNIIIKHVQFTKEMLNKDNWNRYYEACSNFIKYITRKIWPNRERQPTLYSARHQFSANMKASGCTKNEIAALMGHGSDETATQHYGKKIFGTRMRKPEVNKQELSKIKTSKEPSFSFSNMKKNKN